MPRAALEQPSFRSMWLCSCDGTQRTTSESEVYVDAGAGGGASGSDSADSEPSGGQERVRQIRAPATSCCGGGAAGYASDSSQSSASGASCSEDSSWCSLTGCKAAKFHFVPRNGWHPFLRKMHCSARNTMEWMGKGPIPIPAAPGDCWLLPTSDEMALCIARLQSPLVAAGWKLLTCNPHTVSRLSNKASLHDHAKSVGLLGALPQHYASPETASYPCILKASIGQHGKDVYIVKSKEEVLNITDSGFGDKWLLQELISGSTEYSVSLLVENGKILDAICTEYEYDGSAYVWPHVDEISRTSHSDIPQEHLDTMCGFLCEYSGICNFNYKVRTSGAICIFEINTRVGADLACDVPRRRARELFQKLDELSQRRGRRKPKAMKK